MGLRRVARRPLHRSVYDVSKVSFGDVPGFERGRDSTRAR